MSGTILPAQTARRAQGDPLADRPPTARFAAVPQIWPVPFVTPRLPKIHWDDEVSDGDLRAACNVLLRTGNFDDHTIVELLEALYHAPIVKREARDVLNVSLMPLLPPDDPQVAYGINRVRRGKKINPILLVEWRPLILADGHHRTCVTYYAGPSEFVRAACI